MATRKTYTQDFKLDAVRLVTERGLSRARVARDLGIGTQTLRNWLRALTADAGAAPAGGTDAQQLAALRRENELLREERDILKKRSASSRGCLARRQVPFHRRPRERAQGRAPVPGARSLPKRLLRLAPPRAVSAGAKLRRTAGAD